MSAMSELSAEREQELNETRCAYLEAHSDYMALLEKYPVAHRKPWQQDEVSKAEGRSLMAHMRWENAKAMRYKL